MPFIKHIALAFNPLFILFAVSFSGPVHGKEKLSISPSETRQILQEICDEAYPRMTYALLKSYEVGGLDAFWQTERAFKQEIVKNFQHKESELDRYFGSRIGIAMVDDAVIDAPINLRLSNKTQTRQEQLELYRQTCIMRYELF